MNYETKNKKIIIELLKEKKDSHLTIDEISSLLKEKGNKIPLASLYRIIDSFVKENIIRKYVVDNNSPSCYQFCDHNDLHNHFHLLCNKCGKLIHLECGEVNELIKHIETNHNFKVDISKINLYGLCSSCKDSK